MKRTLDPRYMQPAPWPGTISLGCPGACRTYATCVDANACLLLRPRVLAAILTYRPHTTDRLGLLKDTVDTLAAEADAVWVVDNGSGPDELAAMTDVLGFTPWTHDHPIHTCGHGSNLQARILAGAARPGDLCVLSDDDMAWRSGWRGRLVEWWSRAGADVVITGCHVEPIYGWNTIEGRDDFPALYRASTGAASWTYRAESHGLIFPIPERSQGTGDVPACRRVRRSGRIAQLDLAEHVGRTSTWGNKTNEMFGADNASVLAALAGES